MKMRLVTRILQKRNKNTIAKYCKHWTHTTSRNPCNCDDLSATYTSPKCHFNSRRNMSREPSFLFFWIWGVSQLTDGSGSHQQLLSAMKLWNCFCWYCFIFIIVIDVYLLFICLAWQQWLTQGDCVSFLLESTRQLYVGTQGTNPQESTYQDLPTVIRCWPNLRIWWTCARNTWINLNQANGLHNKYGFCTIFCLCSHFLEKHARNMRSALINMHVIFYHNLLHRYNFLETFWHHFFWARTKYGIQINFLQTPSRDLLFCFQVSEVVP